MSIECNKRKEDQPDYKWEQRIKQIAALLLACGTIAGTVSWFGSTVFVTKAESQITTEKTSNYISIISDRVIYCEKDILVIKANLQAIQDGQKEQSIMLREIRDDLRNRNR